MGSGFMVGLRQTLIQGRRLHRSDGDVNQLGGDVLIDPTGIVRLHHVGSGPADRPSVSSLLELVRSDASEIECPNDNERSVR